MDTNTYTLPPAGQIPGVGPDGLFASFREYVTPEEVAKTRDILDGQCSHELIVIATALRGLAEACDEAAQFCHDDGRELTGEDWQYRAQRYRNCYEKIVEEWDGDISAANTNALPRPAEQDVGSGA